MEKQLRYKSLHEHKPTASSIFWLIYFNIFKDDDSFMVHTRKNNSVTVLVYIFDEIDEF